jgi:putative hydrolase of the HAD superfamily
LCIDTTMADISALILDFGGVLSYLQPEDWYPTMAARLEVDAGAFRAAYWEHRHAYDGGLPAQEYWRRVHATLGRPCGPLDLLIQSDVASWTEFREEVWTLARNFRQRGGRTGFLSNGVAEAMAHIRAKRPLELWFDAVVVSCEVGASKPGPLIYEICLSRLGVAPERALFVDDRADNIEGAARLGIETLHFAGDDAVARLHARLTS